MSVVRCSDASDWVDWCTRPGIGEETETEVSCRGRKSSWTQLSPSKNSSASGSNALT